MAARRDRRIAPALRRAKPRRPRVPGGVWRHRRAADVFGSRATHWSAGWAASTGARSGPAIVCRSAKSWPPRSPARGQPGRIADLRSCRTATRALACVAGPADRTLFRGRARRPPIRAVHDRSASPTAWDFDSRGRVSCTRAGADIHLGRDAARCPAGTRLGPADPADGQSPDDRRLPEAGDGHLRGLSLAGQLGTRRSSSLRRLLAAGGDGGAHRPGTRADGARSDGVVTSASAAAMRARVRRRPARSQAPLAAFTTFRVGGPADWLIETRSSRRNRHWRFASLHRRRSEKDDDRRRIECAGVRSRRSRTGDPAARGETCRRSTPIASAPTPRSRINGLVRWTINHGVAGLEAWAGTPGTVGGAIFGNAHFGGRLIGDLVSGSARLDRRRRHGGSRGRTWRSDTIAAACSRPARCFCRRLFACRAAIPRRCARRRGNRWPSASGRSRSTRRAPAAFSRTQSPDATCCPRGSRGRPERWSIAPGQGAVDGGARVSPAHGNFIVNDGAATAADIRRLIDRCRAAVRERFGVELRDEIMYLGDCRCPRY